MKTNVKKLLILITAALVPAFAAANEDDPLTQLLNARAVFSSNSSATDATSLTASYKPIDEIDILLQRELNSVVSDADPLGSLINGEGVFADGKKESVVTAAFNYLNTPYKFGGNDVANGFDCSGLVRAIYLEVANKSLPRTAATQAGATASIARSELEPGDLVFFRTVARRKFSHVGIYVGDNKFIHAPRTGAQVRIEDMGIKYWNTRFTGARRVIK